MTIHETMPSDRRDGGKKLELVLSRIDFVLGEMPHSAVAERLGMNAETVRRQRQLQGPSRDFLEGLCRVWGVNLNWLLCGEGPPYKEDLREQVLQGCSAADLLRTLATKAEQHDDTSNTQASVQPLRLVPERTSPDWVGDRPSAGR
jgi:hypothetical protein